MKECCCESSLIKLENTHYKKFNLTASLISDDEGYGIIVFNDNLAIACFDINFCPRCGKDLNYKVR